jgi:excinuclease ABC subunit A
MYHSVAFFPSWCLQFMPKQQKQNTGPPPAPRDAIIIRGARVHNLKNISLEIPRNSLTVVTGVSGSGKSSLAFDTIYAEGQRRYVESLSSYARQFLDRMDKPDVDMIQGISPAMAIEQKSNTRNPRSTVGTTTEVYDYLRLLFARIGRTFCPNCGREVRRDSVKTVIDSLDRELAGTGTSPMERLRVYVAFPLPVHKNETIADSLANIRKEGFFRVLVRGSVIDTNTEPLPPKSRAADILVLVDRLSYQKDGDQSRIADSVETAFSSGAGQCVAVLADSGTTMRFNQNFVCSECHIPFEEPDPRLFSFNNPFGACPECQGFGRAVGIDLDLVIPDTSKSLRDGAVQPWATPKFRHNLRDLIAVASKAGVRLDVPFAELHDGERSIVLNGFGAFDGIYGFFRQIEKKSYKIYYRVLLSRYRGYTTCPECRGARLRKDALNVRIAGRHIGEIVAMTITEDLQFLRDLTLTPYEQDVAKRILDELTKRLSFLDQVGLGYLTLDRLSGTLSGGESQRINLATSLGSTLVGAVYVLDEPSIGLHPRDNGRLISILKALRDVGNTVIVVEHDREMMMESDTIVDLGPHAGEHGGEVVYCGPASGILSEQRSLTGRYLAGKRSIPLPMRRRSPNGTSIRIQGAAEHNLKNLNVDIPLRTLVCITGVSGSGKSTLVHDVLFAGLRRMQGQSGGSVGKFQSIEGHEHISAVELVDQSPIGRSPRSNPATYIQVFDLIRTLFASTQSAKIHGFQPGTFSFNVPGGRCEACEGDGVIRVEMQFLADLELVCDVCKGTRFKKEVLDVRYREKNIHDVLNMTVSEAIAFFGKEAPGKKIAKKLQVLDDVGLGYIRLGQSSTSLSGGEAQRIKLASHLGSSARDRHTLFVFDEPTTGLHFDDIAKLINCFNALLDTGNSVLIIEHNLDVIKCADYIIDLGPEAGEAGGQVVAVGTPEEILGNTASATGRFLGPYLRKERKEKQTE